MSPKLLHALALFAVLGVAPGLSAATFEVAVALDDVPGSLRAAIAAANASPGDDTIVFAPALAGEFIDLTSGELVVSGPDRIFVTGEGLAQRVILSGRFTNRVFRVSPGAELELDFVEVSDGQAPDGGAGVSGGSPTAGDTGGHGGGIYNEGILVVKNSVLGSNYAGAGGAGGRKTGAVAAAGGSGGEGGCGGGIYSAGPGASVRIENSILRQNEAGQGGTGGTLESGAAGDPGQGGGGGFGGAIYCDGGILEIVGSRIESNRAGSGGFGGGDESDGIGGGGGRGGSGGGVAIDGGAIQLVDSTIRSNAAGQGGLGGDDSGSADDTRGSGGDGGDGGGVWTSLFAADSEAQVSGCLFQANTAGNGRAGGSSPGGMGGGVTGTAGGAGGGGGGLFVVGADDAVWRMLNCTCILNFAGDGGNGGDGGPGGQGGAGGAAGNGGGIAFGSDGATYTAFLNQLTVLSNNGGLPGLEGDPVGAGGGAASAGGGVWEAPGGISGGPGIVLVNSVVALNDATALVNIGDFLPEGANFVSGDPEVAPLADNGGPTETVAPLLGSPLLDGGGSSSDPLATDQRGRPRPLHGAPDIGAFEAARLADARIGRRANPATQRIDDVYSVSGARQVLPVRLVQMRRSRFFVSAQNDGDIADNLRVVGTRANRTLRLSVLRLTGGRINITAQLAAGRLFPGVEPDGIVAMQFDARARNRKLRARQRLLCGVGIDGLPGHDRVVASVTQAPPRRKARR